MQGQPQVMAISQAGGDCGRQAGSTYENLVHHDELAGAPEAEGETSWVTQHVDQESRNGPREQTRLRAAGLAAGLHATGGHVQLAVVRRGGDARHDVQDGLAEVDVHQGQDRDHGRQSGGAEVAERDLAVLAHDAPPEHGRARVDNQRDDVHAQRDGLQKRDKSRQKA